ncbi:MAG: TIM barrel protein [Bacteroidota bacterium]
MQKDRRQFLKQTAWTALGIGTLGLTACTDRSTTSKTSPVKASPPSSDPLFQISLAQWSLHRAFKAGTIDNLDFALTARQDFGITAVEYVSKLFKTRARDQPYLRELKKRADDNGVQSLLIMVDDEGPLAEPDNNIRNEAIKKHYQWVEAAQMLGCHSIRVNLEGRGSADDLAGPAVDGLASLASFAKDYQINVIVENHGGPSSNAQWLAKVIGQVRMPNCGTLPDFGNFCILKKDEDCIEAYDRYRGMQELLPFAKALSAKSYDFDEAGQETSIDFRRMMELVKAGGYRGYVGVEYEGDRLSEPEGVRATKRLLEKVIAEL